MNKLLMTFLKNRGYDLSTLDIDRVANDRLMDIDLLVNVLKSIHDTQKHLVVLSDFDMDGIMAGTILFAGLKELGFNVSLFTPPTEHYGFNAEVIESLVATYPTVTTIITGDVGVTCYEGVHKARELGIDMLITDHHKELDDGYMLESTIHVNPMRLDEVYSQPAICGAMVAYKVLLEYARRFCDISMYESIRRLVLFAGVGTVSDSMPVLYENRRAIKDSLNIARLLYSDGNPWFLNLIKENSRSEAYKQAFEGFYSILQAFDELGKIKDIDSLNEDFYGFYMAPTFNSVKRLHEDSQFAFGIFFAPDARNFCINKLLTLNEQRKELVADEMQAIMQAENPYAPYLYISEAPVGVLGLVATNLMGISGMPTLVVQKSVEKLLDGTEVIRYNGSGRSPGWLNYNSYLREIGISCGGHEQAFGLNFGEDELEHLYNSVSDKVYNILSTTDVASEEYDLNLDFTDSLSCDVPVLYEFVKSLDEFRPFGPGFPKPVVKISFRKKDSSIRVMGSDNQHIAITLTNGIKLLWWNHALYRDEYEMLDRNDIISFNGELSISEFNDTVTLNFIIGD